MCVFIIIWLTDRKQAQQSLFIFLARPDLDVRLSIVINTDPRD